MTQVYIYDTTLRDGTQREGISLSLEDKLKIAKKLDEFGVHYIEGGYPGSNPKDAEFFRRAMAMGLKNAKITAFGNTRRKNSTCEEDANLKAVIGAETPAVTLVGKSWDLHVHDVLDTTMEENLAMISESVAYCKSHDREVIYDAEHFFDGYKANAEYAVATVKVAALAGASSVVLCDTNGGSLPWEVQEIVAEVKKELGDTPIGIHTHDDTGCGVANSLAAVAAGATQVQGTINGYGERVANANLCTIVPDLQLKMGYSCVPDEKLTQLRELSRYVSEIANLEHDDHWPYVGASAFAHKGGLHISAMNKNEASYQHIDPTLVGNERRTVVSELSGRGTVLEKAEDYGIKGSKRLADKVLEEIKSMEAKGFTYESAEASVELMMHRAQPSYVPAFELLDMMVVMQQRRGRVSSEATVKVRVGPKMMHTVASGNGPVNALDKALRKALVDVYPKLSAIKLVDYKVRILDSDNATAATTRVLIDTKMGPQQWSTVGASTNIIDASWIALADSMEYAIMKMGK